MPEEYKKVIRDVVYGYIGITPKHLRLIELPVFQRLRRISQLSLTDLVYPNASHNRFSHSLGVMHLARILVEYLKKSNIGKVIELRTKDYKSIVWAGLLHDIGHLPFSHVCEPVFAFFMDESDDWKDYHVKIGSEIIENPKFGIKEIIGDDEVIKKVTNLINKNNSNNHPFLHEVMTGVCSIDRLDYLKRDAHHAGTQEYAIIDAERILTSTVFFPGDPYMAPVFKKKAQYALEGAILSYFLMYRAIYYHHTCRAAFLLFQHIIWEAFEKYELKNKIRNIYEPEHWNNFDDHRFLGLLHSIVELRSKLEKLLFRQLPKEIPLEKIRRNNITRIYTFIGKSNFNEIVNMEKLIMEELKKRYPKLEIVLLDSPVVIPYPRSHLAEKSIHIWDDRDMEEPIDVAMYAPYLTSLHVASERQHAARIYVFPESLRMEEKFIKDINSIIMNMLK